MHDMVNYKYWQAILPSMKAFHVVGIAKILDTIVDVPKLLSNCQKELTI